MEFPMFCTAAGFVDVDVWITSPSIFHICAHTTNKRMADVLFRLMQWKLDPTLLSSSLITSEVPANWMKQEMGKQV